MLKKIGMIIALGVFLAPEIGYSQETNLSHLFRDWAISHNESTDDIIILRNSRDINFLNEEDRKAVYNFAIAKDSIIYSEPINNRLHGWCGNGFSRNPGKEIWTFSYDKKELRYGIYLEEEGGEKTPFYSVTYQIMSISKKFLKLRVKKEFYQGVE